MRKLFISLKLDMDGMQFASSKALLDRVGLNVGNLAFAYAMSTQIAGERKYYSDYRNRFSELKDLFDVLVFPAANNIGEKSDLGWLADILEKTQLPILMVGLGVQAYFGQQRFAVPPGTRRLIDILRERGTRIGVRGKFTQDFLGDLGLQTAVVTGCPSNFLSPDTQLGATLERKYAALSGNIHSIALNLEYFRLDSERVRILTGWLNDTAGGLMLQSDEDVFGLMRGDYGNRPEKADWIAQYFLGDKDVVNLKLWLAKFGRVYCHVPSWMDYLRCLSVSVGSRFHGNMLAMQAGTPALVFTHDTRTLEMCETMMVPHLDWGAIKPGDTIERLMAGVAFSGRLFDERRQALARLYRDLVTGAGLQVSATLDAICDTAAPHG